MAHRKLRPAQKAVLLSVVFNHNCSIHARSSIESLFARAPVEFKNNKKIFKKHIKKLVAKGYLIKHPSNEITYQITKAALEILSEDFELC